MRRRRPGLIAVALHDVEPRWALRCAAIRAWLAERGADRVTLLAIPAARGRPLRGHPELTRWLGERAAAGDAIAQHGFTHERSRVARWPRRTLANWQGGAAAEFPGLDARAAAARVAAGRAVLRGAGLECQGFVAPGYAYTSALRRELRRLGLWSADLLGVTTRTGRLHCPAVTLGASTPAKRLLSPPFVRLAGGSDGRLLRLDVHPADFDHPRHVAALDLVLAAQRRRHAVTYDDLRA